VGIFQAVQLNSIRRDLVVWVWIEFAAVTADRMLNVLPN